MLPGCAPHLLEVETSIRSKATAIALLHFFNNLTSRADYASGATLVISDQAGGLPTENSTGRDYVFAQTC